MTSADTALRELLALDERLQTIDAEQVKGIWKQTVGCDDLGEEKRAERNAHLAGLRWQYLADPQVGQWLGALANSPRIDEPDVAAIVRIFCLEHDQVRRVPIHLAKEIGAASSVALAAWRAARPTRDFASYLPSFERMVALKQEEADALRDGLPSTVSRHDVFFGYNDPGITTADYQAVMATLVTELQPLIDQLEPTSVRRAPLFRTGSFPAPALEAMARELLDALGFDRAWGRFDVGAAPLCCRVRRNDIRVVVHCAQDELEVVLLHAMHEYGHAAHAHGFDSEALASVFQDTGSRSLAEGCARFWDGVIGHLPEFWTRFHSLVGKYFPTIAAVTPRAFAANMQYAVRSGMRAMSDDLTFCVHLGIRADIEIALLDGSLAPRDVPEVFADRVRTHFGNPPDEWRGALTDPHWAANFYGRYPAFTLGTVFAGQLFAAVERGIPDVRDRLARGDVRSVLQWMTEHVYRHGRRLLPTEIMAQATGSAINPAPWIALMRERYSHLGT